jgi:hypothetical protein
LKHILEVSYNSLNLSFGAAPRKPVSAFEQDDKVVAPAVDLIEIVRSEFSPATVDLISEVLPFAPEDVMLHLIYPYF